MSSGRREPFEPGRDVGLVAVGVESALLGKVRVESCETRSKRVLVILDRPGEMTGRGTEQTHRRNWGWLFKRYVRSSLIMSSGFLDSSWIFVRDAWGDAYIY